VHGRLRSVAWQVLPPVGSTSTGRVEVWMELPQLLEQADQSDQSPSSQSIGLSAHWSAPARPAVHSYASQSVQVAGTPLPPGLEVYLPDAHSMHLSLPGPSWYWPAGQAIQALDQLPVVEYWTAVQFWHAVEPVAVVYWPPSQLSQRE